MRQSIGQPTRDELKAMTEAQRRAHVRRVLEAADAEKRAGRTKHLSYLWKALPGETKRADPSLRERVLPFDLSDFNKNAKKADKAKEADKAVLFYRHKYPNSGKLWLNFPLSSYPAAVRNGQVLPDTPHRNEKHRIRNETLILASTTS